ncbi:MAG TPA: OmpA family protein [Tepidisphaeraceae bacterium]|nr:OmpA family protein [Tepidisphaeraceae bacterium]
MSHWVGISLISFSLVGCVSQEKYNAMKLDRDQLAERLGQSDGQMQALTAERDAYKNQRDQLLNGGNNQTALVGNLTQQLAALQSQYDTLNRQYEDALSKMGTAPALPKPVTDALNQFAAENPDLVDFDSARGIVKFKSDITFNSGSADLTARAADAIRRFAGILNSPAASGYELQVAGHTDNRRVLRPDTIRAGHKDNWYLSAHRAIAVSEALQRDSVAPGRLGVAGYADQHPIADNSTEAGRAQNRRVEVLILPTTVRSSSFASQSATPERSASRRHRAPARQPELNKDASSQQESQPYLNK